VELARELARRFNQQYGETFPEPEALLSNAPRLPGTDNRAMHTSYGNAIALKDTPEETAYKVMDMYTDPNRIHAHIPGQVEGNPVFVYHDIFNPDKEEVAQFKDRYKAGKIGDVEVKRRLAQAINEYLAPLRQKRAEYIQHPDDLIDILRTGTQVACLLVQATLEEVSAKMGLDILGKTIQYL
jgi:tryptophanyl-tRNA synthetase